MSKQPKTADSVMSRLRRPLGRLRDLPIWSKLGLIMIVPTLATIGVGTNGLIEHLGTANDADRARTLSQLSEASGALVHNLQNERAAAAMLLGATDQAGKQRYNEAYTKVQPTVDETKRPYQQERNALNADDLPANFRDTLTTIDQRLADLPAIRSQVTNAKLQLSQTTNNYTTLLTSLISVRDSAAQLAGDTTLGDQMRAGAALARYKEFISQERIVGLSIISTGAFTPNLRREYIETQTGQEQAVQAFKAVATSTDGEFFDQTVAGSDLRKVEGYAGYLQSLAGSDTSDRPFDAASWDTALLAKADLVREVETSVDGEIVDRATTLRDQEYEQLLVEAGVLLGVLLLAILFAWAVARSMARSLRELRHGALSVAQYGLPQAVSRLRDPALSSQLSPVQVANQIAEPLPVRSKDEFGQVTEAFNAVHLEAVRTAAEQAALRASVATMFVNLARRSQILVDRLIGHLDRLERGEEDPDRLAELFQLDHLATRMRRNDENLLVLAGADSTRVQREPAALIDVLRAAQSEVEHYTRIEFGVIDRDIEVASSAVNDLVHLVAELFDNATAFSPPDSHVMVEARRVGDRAVLYVEDRGIGITPDQMHDLNERLATPPLVDVAVSRMMGLVVVARLAARHGVKVELRPASERGTVADVTLPTSVLVPRALSGRNEPGVPQFQGTPHTAPPTPMPVPVQRPPLGPTPLALESGPPSVPPGRPFDPAPLNGGRMVGPSGPPQRSMPAWSDLTGAASAPNGTTNGSGTMFSPRTPTNGQPGDPLPQRRGQQDHWTVDGEVTSAPPAPGIPRQIPANPETRGGFPPVPPVSAPPVPPVSAPPVPPQAQVPPPASAPPVTPSRPTQATPPVVPASSAPPAWPPVSAAETGPTTTPPVPEKLAAALDMTAELPKVTSRNDPSATTPPAAATPASEATAPAPAAATGPTTAAQAGQAAKPRFADETMELPIFRELESAWFRTGRRAAPEEPRTPSAPNGDFVTVDAARPASPAPQGTPTASAPTATPVPAAATRPSVPPPSGGNGNGARREPAGGWQTAADDGWRAASAAAERPAAETTQAGLPKRVPMAQLVPGGVDKGAAAVQRRTPEAVRGLLSAYHRGVQRGRTHPKDDQPTPSGETPQTGLGPAAGSGQKEHEG
ncbi:nitrate- and nitrite sensing domain-containing protein [Phytohabitans sp. LJ34]|uniref:sensor histidine kinase n=1 Tax=Phytohabitans sp. LJ34 TaxID=3452217 RepID=UPI003F8992AF